MEELQRGLLQIGCEMQPRELDALQAVLSEGAPERPEVSRV